MAIESIPLCPITGLPAARRIQGISKALVIGLWRFSAGVDVRRLIAPVRGLALWESPCGLAFFHPMVAGDAAFYADFYKGMRVHEDFLGDPFGDRAEFVAARAFVQPGDRVLDVGCGLGPFRRHIPMAAYTGIDPYLDDDQVAPDLLKVVAEDHARVQAEAYDVVCAFQVIEHVADPLGFARTLVAMVKPGGRLILGAPLWPSPMTDTPNMVTNATPHHLSWWTEGAMRALAAELQLDVLTATALPAHRQHAMFHWLTWWSPVKARGPFFKHAWSWHFSLKFAHWAAQLAMRLGLAAPKAAARSMDVLLVARKPPPASHEPDGGPAKRPRL